MENNAKAIILWTLADISVSVIGLVAYHFAIQWLLIVCALLSIAQWLASLFRRELQPFSYPYLASCLVAGLLLTEGWINGACYGLCLYWASALFFGVIFRLLSKHVVLIIIPIVSVVAYFLGADFWFWTTSVYCTVSFFVELLRGKMAPAVMEIFLACVVIAVSFSFAKENGPAWSKIIIGLLLGGSAYYIVGAIYSFIYTITHGRN